ncbi:hypothetical protein [Flagellimonas onchidii]|uniref:hypothetical protein n=1 Tax=Flagellimonas onchidii TaxID=2562684 RepID=UPI0010A66103|nr:hypothetical protein [Allomuricauda onchidii]
MLDTESTWSVIPQPRVAEALAVAQRRNLNSMGMLRLRSASVWNDNYRCRTKLPTSTFYPWLEASAVMSKQFCRRRPTQYFRPFTNSPKPWRRAIRQLAGQNH